MRSSKIFVRTNVPEVDLTSIAAPKIQASYSHEKEVHIRVKEHDCQICGMSFSNTRGLKLHQNTHSKHIQDIDEELECDICGKKLNTFCKLKEKYIQEINIINVANVVKSVFHQVIYENMML